jgi:hypothetical protein
MIMLRRVPRRTAIALLTTGVVLLLLGVVFATGTSQFQFGSPQKGIYSGSLKTLAEIETPVLGGPGSFVSYPITFNSTYYWLNMTIVSTKNTGWWAYWMNSTEYASFTSTSNASVSSAWSFAGIDETPSQEHAGYAFTLTAPCVCNPGGNAAWLGPGTFYLVFLSDEIGGGVHLTIYLSVATT